MSDAYLMFSSMCGLEPKTNFNALEENLSLIQGWKTRQREEEIGKKRTRKIDKLFHVFHFLRETQ